MHISHWAAKTPDVPAIIMAGSGERVTYRELDDAKGSADELAQYEQLSKLEKEKTSPHAPQN